jgi:hypothetical protein
MRMCETPRTHLFSATRKKLPKIDRYYFWRLHTICQKYGLTNFDGNVTFGGYYEKNPPNLFLVAL